MLNEYRIALPVVRNDGQTYTSELALWEARALQIAGGFTRRPPGLGTWRNPTDGQVYVDPMQPYYVACTPEQFEAVLDEAFRLFPDQVAFYTAQIGTVQIRERVRPAA